MELPAPAHLHFHAAFTLPAIMCYGWDSLDAAEEAPARRDKRYKPTIT